MIDPLTLLLQTSEPLRRAAESTDDPIKLKRVLLELADDFDRARSLMPTAQCVAIDELEPELRGLVPLRVLPPAHERAG